MYIYLASVDANYIGLLCMCKLDYLPGFFSIYQLYIHKK